MFMRKLFALSVVAAALALSGCATGSAATAVAVAQRAQVPAVVVLEAAVTASFHRDTARVAAGVNDDQAAGIYDDAQTAMSRLSTARLAYDATIASAASPDQQQLVEAARSTTDAAFNELVDRLGQRLSVAPKT